MSIRVKTLAAAVEDAKRFIEAATIAERMAEKKKFPKDDPWYEGGQYCAAAKRASMNLTRSLARLRRPE